MTPELKGKFADLRLPDRTLWAPGPHKLTPAVQEVLKTYRATYTHRSPEFKACYKQAADLLRELFHIPDGFTPLIFGHTGSYSWEMVVTNTPKHYRTLGLDIGAFSKKWTQVFQSHGREMDVVKAEWGHGIGLGTWQNALEKGYEIALLIHNETSTGAMLPVESLCAATRKLSPNCLIAIDGVSISGATEVRIDTLRPDFYLWSLQKDFSIPTIGSVMVVSDRAVQVAAQTPDRGYVLDLVEWMDRSRSDQTPMTVADLTLRCLIARMEEMREEGPARFQRHRNLAAQQQTWAKKHGLRFLARPGFESLTVSAIHLPEGIRGPDFVARACELLNVQLAPGYGSTADEAFRIAAMGTTSEPEMAQILEGLSLILDHWPDLQ